jgi:hypothetical protein
MRMKDPHQANARLKVVRNFVVNFLGKIGGTPDFDGQIWHDIPGRCARHDG